MCNIIMKLELLLDEFIAECEYKNLSKTTIRNYTRILNEFIRDVEVTDIEQLNKHIVKDYINNLTLAISSKNQYLRCIMAFSHWYEEEYDVNMNIKIHRLKEQHKIKYTPSDDEVKKLINFYSNNNYMSSRNKTIISCFVNLGLRGNELCGLRIDDVDLKHDIITIRHRKGNIDQQLPIVKELKLQLVKYMNRYGGKLDGLLFVSRNGNKLTIRDIHYMLKKVNKDISPHSLRRYCCTKMLKDGIPIVMVSRFMNHSSIEVTNSYYADIKATDIKF